jgi:thiamine pyrophosphokinase
MTTVLVVTGGDEVPPSAVDDLDAADYVIAADSGLDHAERLGLVPHLVIGDFDSVSQEALERFEGPLDRHPADKDATDIELALDAAIARGPDRIVVVGGHGGRLDHFLANAFVLTTVPANIEVEWRAGHASIDMVRTVRRLHRAIGTKVSLVPIGGDVHGVTTTGLRWPLHDATLTLGTTLGVSNEFAATTAEVSVGDGTLFVIVPGQS